MNAIDPLFNSTPLLPLVLDRIPRGLRLALLQEGVPCRDRQPGKPEGRFVLFDSREGLSCPVGPHQTALDVASLRDGCDRDPFEALVDTRAAAFEWQIGGLRVIEDIARVDKRAVRRSLLDGLRAMLEASGGLWLRVAAYPFPFRSAFNFRLDYDHYDPDDFRATLTALAGHEASTSHYVNGSAYAWAQLPLGRLRGMDVGSHGYWHHTYRTVEENLVNLRRGMKVLRNVGIEPSGFVAPNGRFNRALLAAMESLGITHSSEFGLAYDELPFPLGEGGVLQVPVHPVCLELFMEAVHRENPADPDAAADEAARAASAYYAELAQARYRQGEPIFFYGHPTGWRGRQTVVLPEIFAAVSPFAAVWRTTLTEFQQWWRARATAQVTVVQRDGQYVVSAERMPGNWRMGLEYLRGQHVALLPIDRRIVQFSPGGLAYESRTAAAPVQAVRFDRREGLRGRVRRMIDWEKVTPVDQIGTGTWQNWAKRTLRRLLKP